MQEKPENKLKGYRQIALATTIPMIMVASIVIGWLIGQYLDKLMGTSRVMTIVFLLLGLGAGGLETINLIKKITKEDK